MIKVTSCDWPWLNYQWCKKTNIKGIGTTAWRNLEEERARRGKKGEREEEKGGEWEKRIRRGKKDKGKKIDEILLDEFTLSSSPSLSLFSFIFSFSLSLPPFPPLHLSLILILDGNLSFMFSNPNTERKMDYLHFAMRNYNFLLIHKSTYLHRAPRFT